MCSSMFVLFSTGRKFDPIVTQDVTRNDSVSKVSIHIHKYKRHREGMGEIVASCLQGSSA